MLPSEVMDEVAVRSTRVVVAAGTSMTEISESTPRRMPGTAVFVLAPAPVATEKVWTSARPEAVEARLSCAEGISAYRLRLDVDGSGDRGGRGDCDLRV